MKRRQMTKEELLRYAKESKRLDLVADRAPFTGMAVLCNYNLWKQDRWGQKRLQEYNRQVAAYELQLNTELASLSLLSNRLMRKAEFEIETSFYMNVIGMLGWFWNNRIIKMQEENSAQIGVFDRYIAPWAERLERIIPPPFGLSLIAIGRKRE